jgi:uncharacterized repeat protein (TIGR01451 family)
MKPHLPVLVPRATIALLLLCGSASVPAGTFLQFTNRPANQVVHPNGYTGAGGEFTVDVCLDSNALPLSGNAEQAIRNVVATYNRNTAVLGNLATNNAGKVDFESVLLHEAGHCLGMDHNALGPSEIGTQDFNHPQLYFSNAKRGVNNTFNTTAGADGVRGTRDDVRDDDVNISWFRKGVNDPWALPSGTIDRNTFGVNLADLPGGFNFVELASSFAPCNGGQPNSSLLNAKPATQNTMFPVLCTNNFLRDLAPDDLTTLRIARAGTDGQQGTADDYTPRLQYVGISSSCDIVVQFVNNAGFAFCQVGASGPPGGDLTITTAFARFQNTVDWHFNPNDTTGGGNPSANLGITMLANTANARAGESIVYTLNVSNAGPATASNTIVSVPTPAGLEFVSNTGSCVSAFPCSLGNLGSGAAPSITSTFRVMANHLGGGAITTTATISSDTADNALANNTAMQTTTIWAPNADLSVSISDGGAQVVAGGQVAYTVGVNNLGPSNAATLSLAFPLPAGTNFVSGVGTGWSCSSNASTATCTRSALDTGAQAPLTLTIGVPANYAGGSPLSSSVTISASTIDPVAANNTASDTTPVSIPNANRVFCSGFETGACFP